VVKKVTLGFTGKEYISFSRGNLRHQTREYEIILRRKYPERFFWLSEPLNIRVGVTIRKKMDHRFIKYFWKLNLPASL
jgi:hypothetical protein